MQIAIPISSSIYKYLVALLIALTVLENSTCYAQSYEVIGRLRDSLLNKYCQAADIVIVDNDSSILSWARSHSDGSFKIFKIPRGLHQIWITHPGYTDIVLSISFDKDSVINLGTIKLFPKQALLAPVIVTNTKPVFRQKKDTVEISTSNIPLPPNANVEELLKQIPGLRVDRNGGLTFNGQKIQKLLVDGEDIFGNDPSNTTRNFNADMISKIQIFEKKDEKSLLTGIDDGKHITTLNLSLKESAKKGYFGKTEVGGSTQGYYNNNAIIGSFQGKKQIAALGMIANTGIIGFDGTINDMGVDYAISGGGNDQLGASAGIGIPRVKGGGGHFSNSWGQQHTTGNYQFGDQYTQPYLMTQTTQTLSDTILTQTQQNASKNEQNQHSLSLSYDINTDTLSLLKIAFGGMIKRGKNEMTTSGFSYFNDTLVNLTQGQLRSDVINKNLWGNIMFRKSWKRKMEKSLSVVLGIAKEENTTNGYIYSINNFYHNNGLLNNTDTLDQMKLIGNKWISFNNSLNYKLSITQNFSVGITYEIIVNKSNFALNTFGNTQGKYVTFIDSLSNNYQSDIVVQKTILSTNLQGKDFRLSMAANLMQYDNKQTNMLLYRSSHFSNLNLIPQFIGFYNFSGQKGITFSFSGTTIQPGIAQLQPTPNNTDPIHIVIGNPSLRPSLVQNADFTYHKFGKTMLILGSGINFTSNMITSKTLTDTLGRQITQSVNVNGSFIAKFNASVTQKWKNADLESGFITNLLFANSPSYINNTLNHNKYFDAKFGPSIGKSIAGKLNIQATASIEYTSTFNSINTAVNSHYFGQEHSLLVDIYFVNALHLNSSCYYLWREKNTSFDKNNQTILWDFFITKDFIHGKLSSKIQINNIVGQNNGFNRVINFNQTTDSRYNTIGRYWMFSLIYKFTKK